MPKLPVSPIKLNKEDLIRLHTSLSVLTKNRNRTGAISPVCRD